MPVTFNEKDYTGKQIAVPTKTKDAMLATLENPQASPSRKELAKEILAWYATEVAKPPLTGKSELDKAAQLMVVEFYAGGLWDGTDRLEKRSVDGVEKTVIVNVKSDEVVNGCP